MTASQIVFWIFAVGTIVGALLTVTARNTVGAVMSLVGTFFGVAALYAMLSAHFLAAVQVLVYAGAIMTLFVFVVMVLNREEQERFLMRGVVGKAIGLGAVAYVTTQLGIYLFADVPVQAEAPAAAWGGVADVGQLLFTKYLFAFEAVSLPLLIAVIGAVVVARTPKHVAHEHEGGLSRTEVDDEGYTIKTDDADDDHGHGHQAPAAAPSGGGHDQAHH